MKIADLVYVCCCSSACDNPDTAAKLLTRVVYSIKSFILKVVSTLTEYASLTAREEKDLTHTLYTYIVTQLHDGLMTITSSAFAEVHWAFASKMKTLKDLSLEELGVKEKFQLSERKEERAKVKKSSSGNLSELQKIAQANSNGATIHKLIRTQKSQLFDMDDKIKKGSKVSHSCLNKIQASGMRKTVATTVDKTKLRQTAAVQHSALGSRQMNPNVPSPNFTDKTERNDGGKSDNDDELTAWLADYLGKKSIGDNHSASPPLLSINKREQSTICATTGSDKFSTMNLLKRAWGKQSLCILISFHYFFLIYIFAFFLLKIIELNIYWYFSAQADPYYESLCDLQQISQKKNPYAKMRTILSAIDCIDKEVNRFYDTHPEYKRPVGRYLFVSPLFIIYFSSCFFKYKSLIKFQFINLI